MDRAQNATAQHPPTPDRTEARSDDLAAWFPRLDLAPIKSAGVGGVAWRIAEMLVLFVALPGVITLTVPTQMMAPLLFPALWVGFGACWLALRLDPTFDRTQLWNRRGFARGLRTTFLLFLPLAGLTMLAVWTFRPDLFLNFPRERPKIWAIVMVFYPLLSVYPQEVIWRAFFFHRYEPVIARWLPGLRATITTLILSALLFGYMHILFRHWIAVVLTIGGGLLFALSYARHRSLALVWLEHALWGCLVFTAGLGQFFYMGAVAARGEP